MGVFAGPDLSESGLVLSFDLANKKSYPDVVNYYSTPETLTNGRVGSTSGGNYTDFTSGGPDGGRFTRWINDTGTSGSTAWHWSIDYSNTGLTTGQLVAISFYARCPNGTVSNITLNSPDSTIVTATLDTNWRLFFGTALYGGDYVSTPFVRINRSNTNTFANGATYDIALLKVQKGNVLTDMTGEGSTGTLTNGPTYSSANGGAVVFDGTDDYVNLGISSLLDNTLTGAKNWSISYWVKYTVDGRILDMGNIGGDPTGAVELNTTSINVNNSATGSSLTASLTSSNWNFITLTKDSSRLHSWYLNGVFSNSSTTTVDYSNGGGGHIWKIGRRAFAADSSVYQGSLSQLLIYNRVLTATEIQQNFNATRSRYGI